MVGRLQMSWEVEERTGENPTKRGVQIQEGWSRIYTRGGFGELQSHPKLCRPGQPQV